MAGAHRESRALELGEDLGELKTAGLAVGTSHLASQDDVWNAIREFFTEQSKE